MGIFKAILPSWRNTTGVYDNYLTVEVSGKGYLGINRVVKGEIKDTGFKGVYFTKNELIIIQ